MTNWKYFALFALVVSLTPCLATNKRCVWVIDAVEKENPSMVASVIVPEGKYFLRIRVKCDGMVSVFGCRKMHVDFTAVRLRKLMQFISLEDLRSSFIDAFYCVFYLSINHSTCEFPVVLSCGIKVVYLVANFSLNLSSVLIV